MENNTFTELQNVAHAPSQKRKRSCLPTLLSGMILLLFAVVATVIIYPAPILRFIVSRIEAQSDIVLTFEKAYFSIGGLVLHGVSAQRQNHRDSNVDLTAKTVRIAIPSCSRPLASVSGLRGTYEIVGNKPAEKKSGNGDTAIKPNPKEQKEAKRNYLGGKKVLLLTDAEVSVIDRTPEKPFQATIQITDLDILCRFMGDGLLGAYACRGRGQVDAADLFVATNEALVRQIPLGLLAPYVPVLDDVFASGSMDIHVVDISEDSQKMLHVRIWLLPDCRIKSADEILVPAIQTALKKLDPSSQPQLRDLKGKIEKLKMSSESLRSEVDKVAQILDTLKALAPRDVREKYESYKSKYDRIKNASEEWNIKFDALLLELDKLKVGIVNDTFQHFIETRVPIEMTLHEENGEWQYDWYETVVQLIDNTYQARIAVEYQKRIQEMLDSVDRILVL